MELYDNGRMKPSLGPCPGLGASGLPRREARPGRRSTHHQFVLPFQGVRAGRVEGLGSGTMTGRRPVVLGLKQGAGRYHPADLASKQACPCETAAKAS